MDICISFDDTMVMVVVSPEKVAGFLAAKTICVGI